MAGRGKRSLLWSPLDLVLDFSLGEEDAVEGLLSAEHRKNREMLEGREDELIVTYSLFLQYKLNLLILASLDSQQNFINNGNVLKIEISFL